MSETETNVAISNEDVPKSAKQLEKEAKKAAKLQKLQQKLDKKSENIPIVKEKSEVCKFYDVE